MANNKRFFKTISLAHWHVKLSIAAQLPMVHSLRWEQTCELVINVKNNSARNCWGDPVDGSIVPRQCAVGMQVVQRPI